MAKHSKQHEIMQREPKKGHYGTHAEMSGNAAAADTKGERKEKLINGVAQGKEDAPVGEHHQYNTGRTEGVCYTHDRSHYR